MAAALHQNPSEQETLLPITEPRCSGPAAIPGDETISDNATMCAQCGSPPGQRLPGLSYSMVPVPPNTRDTNDVMAGVDGERPVSGGQPLPRSGSPDFFQDTVPSVGQTWPPEVKAMVLNGRREADVPRDPHRYW